MRARAGVAWLVGLVVCGTSSSRVAGQACQPSPPQLVASRGGNQMVLQVPGNYEYVPSIMLDGSYRMWFCHGRVEGQSPWQTFRGDQIVHATAPSPAGPWSQPVPVFRASGDSTRFDAVHACDPSVIRVNGVYYMYYGGHNDISYPHAGHKVTAIGVAMSRDGLTWTRLHGGQPIVTATRGPGHPEFPLLAATRGYGAGQPSVTFVDGYFYLAYTDTTGHASNPGNGAGIYVMRSPDPTFQQQVEALVAPGTFAPRTAANQTQFRLLEAFSIDWQYVDMLEAFAVADVTIPSSGQQVRLTLWDRALRAQLGSVSRVADWSEGPGLVSRPDKHAVPSTTTCGTVPIDIVRSVGPAGRFTEWGLAHVGFDLATGLSCGCSRLGAVFEGTAVATSGQPWALVVGGRRLHFQRAAPLLQLTKTVQGVTPAIFASIPAGPAMFAGDPVYHSDGTPGAFLLNDGRLWPTSCYDVVAANASPMSYIAPWHWTAYPLGPPLFCVR